MGIAALPANAIRSIGSTQCLTDPASLVKELVDNALDAGATSIFVEITANTIDRVRVRDNGRGIVPEDRSLVCKRHCTSKIKSLEDLHDLGGQSLGFRGEALASAAEMSAKMLLITRIEGEATAMETEYDRSGLAKVEKHVSHPVGTTAQVDDFLSNSPVRKQTAEKHSAKCLTKIKKLLQNTVLARPYIRLSLKILKSNGTKGDWSYAPRSRVASNSVFMSLALDTAIKVFGTKVAEVLRFHTSTWSSTGEILEPALSEASRPRAASEDVFTLECFVVDPKCSNMEVISALGQHISIDNRPVSCNRGMLKQMCGHYKSCLRSAADQLGDIKIIDPLLVMNISCPKGSYDVNVEPAKDDVLFADAKVVLQVVQWTLNDIYGEPRNHQEKRQAKSQCREINGFEILLAKKTNNKDVSTFREPPHAKPGNRVIDAQIDVPLNGPVNGLNAETQGSFQNASGVARDERPIGPLDDEYEAQLFAERSATWKASMCSGNDEELELYSTTSTPSRLEMEAADEKEHSRNINISNPWIFAKLNAPFRTPLKRVENDRLSTSKDHLPTPRQQRGDVANGLEMSSDDCKQSPSTSNTFFPYPLKAFGKYQSGDDTAEATSTSEQLGHGALDSWLQKSNASNSLIFNEQDESRIPNGNHRSYPDFEPISNQPRRGTALRDIPGAFQRPSAKTTARKQRTGATGKSYISPVNDPERVWFESGQNINSHRAQQASTKTKARSKSINLRESADGISPPLQTQPRLVHPDLAIALDYEARKAKATHEHREILRREKAAEVARKHAEIAKQRTLDTLIGLRASQSTPNSPHQRRQAKAIAALQENVDTPAGDAIESSNQATRSLSKQRKSTKLPLESVKEEHWVSDLILPFPTNQVMIASQMQKMVDWDDYVYRGEVTKGLDNVERDLLKKWELQLRQLVGSRYRKDNPHFRDGATVGENEIVLDLCGILSEPGLDDA